jgi:hypothetical protein
MFGRSTSRVLAAPVAAGALALVVAGVAVVPSLRPGGWSPTVLPRVDDATPLGAAAKRLDPGFRTVHPGAYDGQFYWGIAVDPIATGDVHEALDRPSYRYGHPLYGWLGWILSAGRASAVPIALLVAGLASFAGAAACAAALGRRRGGSGLECLFVVANPGLVYAAVHDLAEPLGAALLLGSLAAYLGGRKRLALAGFALLPLTKEALLLVPLSVAAWELWRRRAGWRTAALLGATLLPSICWWIYARATFGEWFTSGDSALGTPFAGWKRALVDAGVQSLASDPLHVQVGEETLIVLIGLLALLAVATVFALRARSPVDLIYLALAVLAACLATNATANLRDALRNTSLLIVLSAFVIASPPLLPRSRARRAERSSTARPQSPS